MVARHRDARRFGGQVARGTCGRLRIAGVDRRVHGLHFSLGGTREARFQVGGAQWSTAFAEHGNEEAAERCLDAFLERHPETGPVVSIDPARGTLSLTIAVDATDPWAAGNLASRIWADGLDQSRLLVTPILDVAITAVDLEDDLSGRRELIRA